jgi:hypothetical protein
MNFMDGPPRYIVLDGTAQAKGLGCTADQLADALRTPLAAVGVRLVRRRGGITRSLFSQFQARGLSRRQYEAKAIQVAQIVDEVSATLRGHKVPVRQASGLRNQAG